LSRSTYERQVSRKKTEPHFGSTRLCENSENSRDLEKSTLQIDPVSTIATRGGVGRPLKTRFEEVFTQPYMDTARFAKLIFM